MRKIKLTDGTEFEVDLCGVADGYLRMDLITNSSISTLANLFDNPELTSTVECYYDDMEIGRKVYEGYTYLYMVGHESDHIVVMLRQPAA